MPEREILRGDVWWISPDDDPAAAPHHPHPHVVLQDDLFNRSRIPTVVVCALTSNLKRMNEPGNVRLDAGEGGVERPSVVVVSQVSSVERSRLGARIDKTHVEYHAVHSGTVGWDRKSSKPQLYVLLDRLHYTGGRPIFHAQTYCVEGRNHIFSTTER